MSRQEAVTVIKLDTSSLPAQSQQVQQVFGQMAKSGEVSAGQIRNAMRTLPAQFTDVATQLAGGQSPFLVLLQQGGQVKDQFGGIGNALRGIGSLLSPAVLGVAGMAALAGVLALAARDAEKLRNALALSNNASGLTSDRFETLAQNVSAASHVTETGAKEIALALVQSGGVSNRVLESMAIAAARVADVSGKSGAEVAADFAKMGANVADWAAEHNKAWNFITAEQYAYIKRLELQGKTEEAQIFISKQITGQLESQRTDLGYLQSAWEGVAKMASGAWQAMLGFGKADTVGEQLAAARDELGKVEQRLKDAGISNVKTAGVGMMEREKDEIRQRIANLSELQRLEARGADAASARAQKEQARIAKMREAEKGPHKKADGPFVGPPSLAEQFPGVVGLTSDPFVDAQRLGQLRFDSLRQSELGSTNAVDQALRERAEQRRQQQGELLQSLVDANEKANLELIGDDEKRALAQVDLERKRLQRQIDAVYGSAPERAAAEAAADGQAQAQRQGISIKFAKDTALVTREETRDALANAFRDTKNPIKAFGDALGNIVFQRVTTNLADALLTSAFGAGKGFNGGFIGNLLSGGGGATYPGTGDYNTVADLAGMRAGGGPVDAGKAYLVGEMGPEVLRMGAQSGRIVPNRALGGRGSTQITLAPIISIDARSDQAQVAQLVSAAMAQTQRDFWAQMHARGIA
jgi:phage-related minor tail protein